VDGPRACLEYELPALVAAANQVFRPLGGDMARDYPLLFSLENLRNLRIVTDRDAVIAHSGLCVRAACWDGATAQVAALGAVFTGAEHRGRGLGAAVVADALACARAQGVSLALVSGDGPLYQRQGFATTPAAVCRAPAARPAPEEAGEPTRPSASASNPAAESRVRAFGDSGNLDHDLDLAARWYAAEPVHFVRDRADWRALWNAQVVFAWPARWWMVERHGSPVGYLVVAQRARRRVLELAGDRAGLLAAAPLVADDVLGPAHDAATEYAADALGWTRTELRLPQAGQWLTGQGLTGHVPTGQWLTAPPGPSPLPWYGLNYV
jgi:predicted N-acetyltransferase YhbS